jgi:hypothetical protein
MENLEWIMENEENLVSDPVLYTYIQVFQMPIPLLVAPGISGIKKAPRCAVLFV